MKTENANLLKTVDLKYRGGYVECACGWRKDLGDGFNGYHIDRCPSCSKKIHAWSQRKVVHGHKNNYTADIGKNVYFVINKCIHVRFLFAGQSYTGLSLRKAEAL